MKPFRNSDVNNFCLR